MKIMKQIAAIWISYILVMMPLYAAGVQVDGTTHTTLETAPNGTQVVNIANPNATGLSHNKFSQYNVDSKGLILNNSISTTTNTKLAGYIYGNKNLTAPAKIILNEVTSSARSNLTGFTEVAGSSADLVIANPNGITLNGAGFINTSNIILTTGRPILNGGVIDYFDIQGGDISIQEDGLDLNGQESAYLYSHYLTLNAKLHAKNLDIKLGKNQIDYDSKTILDSENSNEVGLLLDASALGGMYANRINLVGTDRGLGVNLPPEVLASNGDITISNDGHVLLQKITATEMINTNANGNVNITDTLYAKNININTKNTLDNSALLSAKESIILNAKNIINSDTITAGMNEDASANVLGELAVTADLVNNSGKLQATKQLSATSQTLNNSNGHIISSQNAFIDATIFLLNNSGIYTGNNLEITTNMLNNVATSNIQAGNNLQIDAIGDITNASNILAGGSLALKTLGTITNNKLISSQEFLTLNANTLLNNDTISGGIGASTINVVSDITNNARISSANNLEVQGSNITNSGFFSSGNDLQITSRNLTNNQTIFSANNMRLYTTNRLLNNEASNIYAFNDLTMAANAVNERTASVDNVSAFIETYQGDINLYAKTFTNKRSRDMNDAVFLTSSSLSDSVYINQFMPDNTGANSLLTAKRVTGDNFVFNVADYGFKVYMDLAAEPFNYHFTTFGVVVNEQTPYDNPNYQAASLLAGRNLNINANNVINEMSNIASINNMNIDVTNSFINRTNQYSGNITLTNYGAVVLTEELLNAMFEAYQDQVKVGDTVYTSQTSYLLRNNEIIKGVVNAYGNYNYGTYTLTDNNPAHVLSSITAGGNININAPILGNGSIKENEPVTNANVMAQETESIGAQSNSITLPQNDLGLFVINQDSDVNYFIETNPNFTLYANFIGSDYLLDRLNLDPELTTRRLGDDFYENRLVSQSILSQTGQRFLDESFTSDMQQFTYLMDNALIERVNLKLVPGIALTTEQIQSLTSDIVWMEEQLVQGNKVLVPVVYIANAKNYKLQGSKIVASENLSMNVQTLQNSGALQASENITLNVNSLTNTNIIHAKQDLHINATDKIDNINGTLQANKDIHLRAENDINNISATVQGENITLISTDGSVNNQMYSKDATYSGARFINKTTHIGDVSKIEANQELIVTAQNTIHNQGSQLGGHDVKLTAQNIIIDTVAKNKDMFIGDGDNYNKVKATQHSTSELNANSIQINATDTVLLKGATINAQENIALNAKNINISAVNDAHYEETKRTSKHTFSTESTTTKKATSTNIASTLSGENIYITTTADDINIIGSKLDAAESLTLKSQADINVLAGYDGSMHETHTEKSGFFSGGNLYSKSEDLEGRLTKTAINTELKGTNVSIHANNDVFIEGVDIHADESIELSASTIELKNSENTEQTYSKHTKLTLGVDNLVKTIVAPMLIPTDVTFERGELSYTFAEGTYDKETKVTTKTMVNSSKLDAQDISLRSEKDITIQGSNLNAEENINLQATNNITIKEAKETTTTNSSSAHGKVELKGTLKNEFVQIGYAIDDATKATEALKKAKDDYSKYKDDLASQQAKLSKLQADYANAKVGIEQADIDEMQTYLNELKNDEAYYVANIALATATLATKLTAVAAQGSKASSTTATFGFNPGAELDIDAIEHQLAEYKEKSIASNLHANNINLQANNTATIQGSNLQANNEINIAAKDTNIVASRDVATSKASTSHQNITLGYEVYGGVTTSTSADTAQSTSSQLQHTNSGLQANTININTQETTAIKGANLHANEQLNINTNNLEVSSVQNTTSSKSNSKSLNLSTSGFSLTGGGGSLSNSSSSSAQTLLTSLSANQVNINTTENTTLKGATLASIDEQGNDNNNLNLTTNTLNVSSLNNTSNSKSISVGANIGGSFENNTLNNVSIDFSNDTSHSKTKTLATLGEGNIQITDQTNSDTQMLNRDIANNEVNIYDIESHKGLQGELDTRLLTQDGRNQIAEDLKKTTFITNSLLEAATKDSVSLVGDRANGETGFFENVKNKTDLFEGTKKFVNDPENTQARDTLLNPNATPEELLQATQQLHSYVANEMGITPIELELILDTSYKGFTSSETGKAYLAINLHDTMGDVTNTTLNETSDVVDLQRDAGIEKTQNYTNNRDEYSTDFGNLGQELLNTQYSQTTGSSINNTSYNQVDASLQNHSSTIATNTQNFQTLDKSQGAHRQLNSAEINFLTNKKNIEEFAKIKYNTDNPTSEELQGAEHSLVQEGLRGVDKAWSLVLGTDTDTQAREYLSKNSDAFKAKDAYEFKDGTTNGEVEVSDLSKQDYEKLKTLYQNNVAYKTETNQEGARFLGEEYQTDTEKTLNNLKNIGIEEVNQAIRDFVPNTIEAITDTPQIANSAKNYLGNILPSTTQERMNELYMQGDAGSKTQANLATMDTIGTASMITGVGAVGKNAVESVGNSAVKSVDDSLQINTNFVSASGNPVELVKVGSKSDWDKTINKEFKPNTAYQLDNGHTYVTNTNGNVDFVEADLSKITMDRNNYQQSNVGRSGNIGDQGGHLIASSLGGAGDKINLVPMASVLNNGTWKKMESDLAKALDAGKNVSVKIDVGYPDGGGVRPNSFTVNYSIDGGKPITKEFEQ